MTEPTTTVTVDQYTFRTTVHADRVFREALAAGYYPIVPPALTTALTASDRQRELQGAIAIIDETVGELAERAVADLLAGRPVDPVAFSTAVLDAQRRAEFNWFNFDNAVAQQISAGWSLIVGDDAARAARRAPRTAHHPPHRDPIHRQGHR